MGLRRMMKKQEQRRAEEVAKAEDSGSCVLSLQLEDQRLKLKIPFYPGYSV